MKLMRKWCSVGLLIGVSGFIFYQGTRNLETSLSISDQVVNRILAWGVKDPMLSSPQYFEWYPYLNYVIRKLAHFTEYAVFGGVFALYFNQRKKKRLDVVVYALLPVLIVAILDEYFQKFAGRGSLVSDVLIDGVGGFVGINFVLVMIQLQGYVREIKRLKGEPFLKKKKQEC